METIDLSSRVAAAGLEPVAVKLLCGETFTLEPYTMTDMVALEKQHGVSAQTLRDGGLTFDQITGLIWFALRRKHPNITIQKLRDKIMAAEVAEVVGICMGFFSGAIPETSDESPSSSSSEEEETQE